MDETSYVLLAAIGVLALLLCVAVYALREFVALFHRHSSRLMMPPRAVPSWPLGKGNTYACFLSHYKKEAGAEARFIKDLIEPMLGEKVRQEAAAQNQLPPQQSGWGWEDAGEHTLTWSGLGLGLGLGGLRARAKAREKVRARVTKWWCRVWRWGLHPATLHRAQPTLRHSSCSSTRPVRSG